MKKTIRSLTCIHLILGPFLFVIVFSKIGLSQTHSVSTNKEKIADSYVHTIFLSNGPVVGLTPGFNDTTTD